MDWRSAGGSVRGAAHVIRNLPNQDAVALSDRRGGPSGDTPAIAAVADGHGGGLYFRSDVGARAAVEAAVSVLAGVSAGSIQAGEAPEAILQKWRETVRRHIAEHPFSPASLDRKGAEQLEENPLLAYGCTLLAAAACRSRIVYLQLGDGDILAIDSRGETTRVFPRDPRFAAGQTVSLCQPDAAAEFQIRVEPLAPRRPAVVLLSTDGYANAFQSDADFLKIGPDYLVLLGRDGLDGVAERLPGFLNHASEAGSADDISLAILADLSAVPRTAPAEPLTLHFLDHYADAAGNPGLNRTVLYTCLAALLILASIFFFTTRPHRAANPGAPAPIPTQGGR
jgi:serine/threonine protein phosphatase PrpC